MRRSFDIPNVGINETFLKTLEKEFTTLGGDKLASGKIIVLCCYMHINNNHVTKEMYITRLPISNFNALCKIIFSLCCRISFALYSVETFLANAYIYTSMHTALCAGVNCMLYPTMH